MAFGTGSAIAHQAVGAIAGSMGGGSSSEEAGSASAAPSAAAAPAQQVGQSAGPCGQNSQDLYKCLNEQNGNAAACQYFFDALTQCQNNAQYQNQLN